MALCRSLLRHAGPGDGRSRHLVTASACQPPQSGCADHRAAFMASLAPSHRPFGRFPNLQNAVPLPPVLAFLLSSAVFLVLAPHAPAPMLKSPSWPSEPRIGQRYRTLLPLGVCPCSMRCAGILPRLRRIWMSIEPACPEYRVVRRDAGGGRRLRWWLGVGWQETFGNKMVILIDPVSHPHCLRRAPFTRWGDVYHSPNSLGVDPGGNIRWPA